MCFPYVTLGSTKKTTRQLRYSKSGLGEDGVKIVKAKRKEELRHLTDLL